MWLKLLFVAVISTAVTAKRDIICDTHGKILKAGYPAESYDVNTDDGYVLEVNRIPWGKYQDPSVKRPVVFVMHGLMAASSSFVELGPEYALGYNLADAGFDVWMGNARGVCNSRRHILLNPDDRREKHEFFDFTWEQIATDDIPSMIDFVLKTTGQEKLHYIGHSQGGTAFLVMTAMRPEYHAKIKSAHLLAGVGYQNYFPHKLMRFVIPFTDIILAYARLFGIVEVDYEWFRFMPISLSAEEDNLPKDSRIKIKLTDLGTSAALKQFAHFGQNIRDKKFRRWNYSPLKNLAVYGSLAPPLYDLSNINVPITMHYTTADTLLDERDVFDMVETLPNATARKIPKSDFSHYDFVRCSSSKSLVNDYIVNDLLHR